MMAGRIVITGRAVLGDDRVPVEPVEEEVMPEAPEAADDDLAGEPATPEMSAKMLLDQLSDERIREMSDAVAGMASSLTADQAESLIDDWADYITAAMALKARLNSVSLAAIPNRNIQEKMEEALRPMLEEVRPYEPVT